MSNLTLVKNDRTQETKKRSGEDKAVYDSLPDRMKELLEKTKGREFNTITYWDNKYEELKTIARREIILINNFKDLSEGKKRLYDKALKAFQTFADADDIREESEEMQSIAYVLLLYYIDKLYPDVSIELSADDEVSFYDEGKAPSDVKHLKLLQYLVRTWIRSNKHDITTAFHVMIGIYTDY